MTADTGEYSATDLAQLVDGFAGSPGCAAGLEGELAGVLAGVLRLDEVSPEAHFFEDLGADSLVMAQFCSRLRKRADLPSASIKDIYRNPTLRELAAALASPPAQQDEPRPAELAAPAAPPAPGATGAATAAYLRCGALQFLVFLGYTYLLAVVVKAGYDLGTGGSGVIGTYLRVVLFTGALAAGFFALPVAAKWLLIGRWTPRQIPVWSLAYVRFWIVKTLVQRNPLVPLMVGSPLYPLYLRALGARIGAGAAIFSRHVPVCTDLLTIGAGTVIRKNSFFQGYRAHAGMIETGPVTLGRAVVVAEATVLDIGTSMGDGAQLGHASALHGGQAVPAGERWHGSPAQRTRVDFRAVGDLECSGARRLIFGSAQLLNLVLVTLPLGIAVVAAVLIGVRRLAGVPALASASLTDAAFYRDAAAASLLLFAGTLLVGLLALLGVSRLFQRAITADRVYPLYGVHYAIQRGITRLTNAKFYILVTGDSSWVVNYLRRLGYGLNPVEQTGTNFGQGVSHDTPFLAAVGTGTVVADGLAIINAEVSSTSFRVTRTSIGRRNYLGNFVTYPSRGRTGDDCLLATKVMVPIDGERREGVGLLGSPCFEIPRVVARDSGFALADADALRRGVAAKNRHNAVTIALFLAVRLLYVFAVMVFAEAVAELNSALGVLVFGPANVVLTAATVGYFVLAERAVMRLAVLRPRGCSIYDRDFWRHERFWKVPPQTYMQAFNGTPFKNVVWRLLGVRIGRRVFDDGLDLSEKAFLTLGDDCTLNAGCVIQCHSQEDSAFKSDRIEIGAGVTVGIAALVHYGTRIGERAQLAPDSFLMKGEEVPAYARWGGNPAREMPAGTVEGSSL